MMIGIVLGFGYDELTIKIKDQEVIKSRNRIEAIDKKIFSINAKGMNVLYCYLIVEEFNCISTCITTQEIWKILEVTH